MNYAVSPAVEKKTSHFNHVSNTSQQYEDQFWKLKAQKAAIIIDDLKMENLQLNKKVIELAKIEQELREKIIYYQDDWRSRSRQLTSERTSQKNSIFFSEDKITCAAELERLYKQIRIMKNTHQLQLAKLSDQNKKLNKQLDEGSKIMTDFMKNEQKLKQFNKINEELVQLKRKLLNKEQSLNKLRDQKGRLLLDNEELRKQIKQMKAKEDLRLRQEEDKLLTYRNKLDELSSYRSKRDNLTPRNQEEESIPIFSRKVNESFLSIDEEKQQLKKQLADCAQEITQLRNQIEQHQKNQSGFVNQMKFQKQTFQNYQLNYDIKIKKMEGQVADSRKELNEVLKKLSPLLGSNKAKQFTFQSKQSTQQMASLTLLQIFLKRYKIQSF